MSIAGRRPSSLLQAGSNMALTNHRSTRSIGMLLALVALSSSILQGQQGTRREQREPTEDGFRFRSGVELINVSATVTDQRGRFVSGLLKEDFSLYEDGQPQNITHFSADRVPVSLGLVLDASGSMDGEKWSAALNALDRFLFDLLDPADEVFLYTFNTNPDLVQDWTTDRQRISRALGRIRPNGGTALLDAVSEAVPLADTGRHRKKAVVVISDGNDTSSHIDLPELKQLIRETEVLVYAIGIDGREPSVTTGPGGTGPRFPIPVPFPVPGRRYPIPPSNPPPMGPTRGGGGGVDIRALRDITDDSGGRTELIRSGRDLVPATTSIADELSQQYYLGYPAAAPRDGRWHAIRVDTRDTKLRVRARRGYVATP
jgi:Ca-activated chloride channel family protein